MSEHTIDIDPETGEVKSLEVYGPGVAETLARAEIDTQISTAKRYPRNPKKSKDKAMSIATMDEETAETCFYALKRSGKTIEGPSIRLAEIVSSTWGNIRVQSRIVDVGAKTVTAEAVCHDLESNTAVCKQATRRITDRNGRRYNDDMIAVTCQAAASVAMRNAIFAVVPMATVKPIYQKCREVVKGSAETLASRRDKALGWFTKAGASVEDVLGFLSRASIDEITLDDLVTLRGVVNRIKDENVPVDVALANDTDEAKSAGGGAGVQKSNLEEVIGSDESAKVDSARAEKSELTSLISELRKVDPEAVENVTRGAPNDAAALVELRGMKAKLDERQAKK